MSLAGDALALLSFWRKDGKNSQTDPVSQSIMGAAESLLNKEAKLELAQRAIMTQDLQALAAADRAAAQQLRNKHMGKQASAGGSGDDVGDLIICDDYCNIKAPPRSRLMTALAGAGVAAPLMAAAGLATWLALGPVLGRRESAVQPPAAAHEWWQIEEVKQPDGTWKELGRKKLRARPDGSIEEMK